MNKQQWFKQAMTIGLCTTIGFSALLATGAGTAPAAASAVSADSVSADSVSASSTGSKVVSFGKSIWGRVTSSVPPLQLHVILTAPPLLNLSSKNMVWICPVRP